jgi:hypothetical protein
MSNEASQPSVNRRTCKLCGERYSRPPGVGWGRAWHKHENESRNHAEEMKRGKGLFLPCAKCPGPGCLRIIVAASVLSLGLRSSSPRNTTPTSNRMASILIVRSYNQFESRHSCPVDSILSTRTRSRNQAVLRFLHSGLSNRNRFGGTEESCS